MDFFDDENQENCKKILEEIKCKEEYIGKYYKEVLDYFINSYSFIIYESMLMSFEFSLYHKIARELFEKDYDISITEEIKFDKNEDKHKCNYCIVLYKKGIYYIKIFRRYERIKCFF